jgi:hypothetical protein
VRRAEEAELPWPFPEVVDDDALDQLLYPEGERSPGSTRALPDWS